MSRDLDQSYLSELESEYELEMDDAEFENEDEIEGEADDEEFESMGDYEGDEEFEYETSDGENSDFGERFHELSQMEFESESELDQELESIVDNMADHFSFRKFKKFGKGLLKSKLGRLAMSKIPGAAAVKGVTQLLNGDLKGFAKSAMSLHPGIAAAMPALNALGFEAGEPEANRDAWDNFVEVAQNAFANAADSLNENAADPMVAHEVAKNAFRNAVRTVSAQVAARGTPRSRASRSSASGRIPGSQTTSGTSSRQRGKKRVVYLRPGEYLVVVRTRR